MNKIVTFNELYESITEQIDFSIGDIIEKHLKPRWERAFALIIKKDGNSKCIYNQEGGYGTYSHSLAKMSMSKWLKKNKKRLTKDGPEPFESMQNIAKDIEIMKKDIKAFVKKNKRLPILDTDSVSFFWDYNKEDGAICFEFKDIDFDFPNLVVNKEIEWSRMRVYNNTNRNFKDVYILDNGEEQFEPIKKTTAEFAKLLKTKYKNTDFMGIDLLTDKCELNSYLDRSNSDYSVCYDNDIILKISFPYRNGEPIESRISDKDFSNELRKAGFNIK